ncbi:hypothetical protein KIH86_24095 [Paenibacillus sp. HN-1]|uniref:hypothetical protein n=1 Tax=Paenibacillus TaxID=44249 RepID=UPI001CA8C5D7|nr:MULTISPECIES: hypothetical protein [Paenibacillus]MBY9081232.1 hypothetical protein [Paenibacillus sp. CGMCC 1.18879]MBY9087269.1 hypothetical protein [Paenibacillus sinensis]
MAGSFQTSREMFGNPIWKNIVEFRLFFLIYGNAVFSDEGVRLADDLVLRRGEWCRSTRKLQEDLEYIENRQVKRYSTSVINRCIKKLERSQRICTRMHELGTIFTVLNYDEYQFLSDRSLQVASSNHASYMQDDCTRIGELGTVNKHDKSLSQSDLFNIVNDNLEHNLEQSWNTVGTVEEQSGNNNKNVNKDKKVKNDKKKDIIPKIYFAEFVSLTQDEYDKLQTEHGEERVKRMIEVLDNYKGSSGKKYSSDYRAILNWVVKRVIEDESKLTLITGGGNGGKYGAGITGYSEANRKAASRGEERFVGTPGRESGVSTEEVRRLASNFE